jgi:hypothetical protein
MNRFNWRFILGAVLVGMGAIGLLQTLGWISTSGLLWGLFFGFLFFVGGVAFLSVFIRDRLQWWALIPGVILLFLGMLIGFSELLPGIMNRLGGSFFLGGISLSFWLVYFFSRKNWWAIIPGGVLLTLALVAGIPESFGFEGGGIFFLGLAATFALLAVVENMTWAWIPAGVLFVMGALISMFATRYLSVVWPAALILGGLYMLYRAFIKPAA